MAQHDLFQQEERKPPPQMRALKERNIPVEEALFNPGPQTAFVPMISKFFSEDSAAGRREGARKRLPGLAELPSLAQDLLAPIVNQLPDPSSTVEGMLFAGTLVLPGITKFIPKQRIAALAPEVMPMFAAMLKRFNKANMGQVSNVQREALGQFGEFVGTKLGRGAVFRGQVIPGNRTGKFGQEFHHELLERIGQKERLILRRGGERDELIINDSTGAVEGTLGWFDDDTQQFVPMEIGDEIGALFHDINFGMLGGAP